MNETNTTAMGGIRGIGSVTGITDPSDGGNWVTQNGIEAGQNSELHQGLIDWHNDLHDEIEDNDVSPKSGKKLRIVSTK